jgi:hypothetical protein
MIASFYCSTSGVGVFSHPSSQILHQIGNHLGDLSFTWKIFTSLEVGRPVWEQDPWSERGLMSIYDVSMCKEGRAQLAAPLLSQFLFASFSVCDTLGY